MCESLAKSDVERLVKTLVGVANGLKVGNDRALIHETANRSGYSCDAVQLVIGLCAVFWCRAEWEDLEFPFKNALIVKVADGDSTYVEDLAGWEPYQAVASLISLIKPQWLYHFSRTYSTEHAEIRSSMPCVGNPDIGTPTITILSLTD